MIRLALLTIVACSASPAHGQPDPTTLPLLYPDNFRFVGAFRMPATEYGSSSLNYSEGPFTVNADSGTILIVGHSHHQQIAEFEIPPLVQSSLLSDLNMAPAPLQDFSTSPLWRVSNPQDINRIGGLAIVESSGGPRLLVNGYEYYDAPGDNTHTTVSSTDPSDIAGSTIAGYFTFAGGAGHTSGWMSPVPPEWRDSLGGPWITGQSSGIPIISRTSVGPSAFAFNPADIVDSAAVPNPVPTIELLDFSLASPLASDLSNSSGTNDLWTHLSRATYGVILPGSRTYATFGYSGGHGPDGVCYKCTQDNGNTCGGYCAPDSDDYYQFLWLWDVNDLLAVRKGLVDAHDVAPYWHGPFPTPFENGTHQIGGGSYDPASRLLYLTIQKGDRAQGPYSNPAVVVVYEVVPFVSAEITVALEGPYDTSGDSLSTSLPLMPPGVADSVTVELRTGDPNTPPMTVVAEAKALILSDGAIVGLDGASPLSFPGVDHGDYQIVIRHRNHLDVMSRDAIGFSDAAAGIDFTSDSTMAFGPGSMKALGPDQPTWALFAGDEDGDGNITATDFNAWLAQTKSGAAGYMSADFNLDGLVTAADFNLWLVNTKAGAASHVP